MGKTFERIDASLAEFIRAQQMFFVATAPSSPDHHINLSPKGLDSLRIIDAHTVAYLDHVGSGIETIAHLRENGRIVVMVCAFEGPPRIVRLHGRGSVIEAHDPRFGPLRGVFPPDPAGRAIVHVSVDRISDSCGFGVPRYEFRGQRSQLPDWAARKGPQGLAEYQRDKNTFSIDGLAGLRGPAEPDA